MKKLSGFEKVLIGAIAYVAAVKVCEVYNEQLEDEEKIIVDQKVNIIREVED